MREGEGKMVRTQMELFEDDVMDIVYQGGLDDLDEPETLPLRIVELINRMDATEDPDERERLRVEIAFLL